MYISNSFFLAFLVFFVFICILLIIQIRKKSKLINDLKNINISDKNLVESLSNENDKLKNKYSSIISVEIELRKIQKK